MANDGLYICPVCQNGEHPEGAQYCCICGTPIENESEDNDDER